MIPVYSFSILCYRIILIDFCYHWRGLDNSLEQYALRFESKHLREMGEAMEYLLRIAVQQATTEALKFTVISSKHHRPVLKGGSQRSA